MGANRHTLLRKAKFSVFRMLGMQQPDAPLPDLVRIMPDGHGLYIRFTHDDSQVQRMLTWNELETCKFLIVEETVKQMLTAIAEHQYD